MILMWMVNSITAVVVGARAMFWVKGGWSCGCDDCGADRVERFAKSLLCDLVNRTTWKMSRYYLRTEFERSLLHFRPEGAIL